MNNELIDDRSIFTPHNCGTCIHQKVCALKDELYSAQNSVDNALVPLKDNSCKKLADFSWIIPVKVQCKHYIFGRF